MKRFKTVFVILISLILAENLMSQKKFSYLALGDSYTIGESVPSEENWPHQLKRMLNEDGIDVDVEIIATTGWRTDELIKASGESKKESYDLVTLLIGVNNQYQGRPFEQYEKEAVKLIKIAIEKAGNDTSSVMIVSIPDYAYSPFGEKLKKPSISEELDRHNAYMQRRASEFGIPFIDITPISRSNGDDLITDDGLHPSGHQYGMWVEKMMVTAAEILRAED